MIFAQSRIGAKAQSKKLNVLMPLRQADNAKKRMIKRIKIKLCALAP